MQFESLVNELLLELFKYLSTSHTFHAFHGLNSRFDRLIHEYFRSCDFDTICQQHLKQMANRITSLCLSDDDDTPGQIDQFFAHGFTFDQFTNIRSEIMMNKIIIDLTNLSNLTHLTSRQCYFSMKENISFINNIWSLPKLVYFCVKIEYKYRQSHHFVDKYRRDNGIFIHPTIISSTIECLSFLGVKSCDIIACC
jgi:hypothetical protein